MQSLPGDIGGFGHLLMVELRFHHFGIACHDLSLVRAFVKSTHAIVSDSGMIHDPKQDVDLCLLTERSGLRLELVSGGVVAKQVAKGITYYHNCYEVEDLDAGIRWLRKSGCMPVLGPIEAVLFGNRRVAFLMSPMGLVELLER